MKSPSSKLAFRYLATIVCTSLTMCAYCQAIRGQDRSQNLASPAQASDDLQALSDEFDDASSLSHWLRIHETEATEADQLKQLDIGKSKAGWITMIPHTSSWYRDWRGVLLYKEVTGKFIISTRVSATDPSGRRAPTSQFSLAGLMARTPRQVTPATWKTGHENYLFLSVGATNPPGVYQYEVKTTVNSDSHLEMQPTSGAEHDLRIVRIGSHFILMRKSATESNWTVQRRYQRSDMPETLQVGMTVYTDWPNVEHTLPEVHNKTVIRNGNPGLSARFDYVRFERPKLSPGTESKNYSDAVQVPDTEILRMFGDRQ